MKDVEFATDERLALKTQHGILLRNLDEIAYCQADANYTIVRFANDKGKAVICKTLKEVECMLPAGRFARVHRSWIVNIMHVTAYIVAKNHVLVGDKTIPVARNRKKAFLKTIIRGSNTIHTEKYTTLLPKPTIQ